MKSRILVVDDEESIREFLEIMLKKEGYEVSCAEDGQVAVDILKKKSFDLVISDMQMPNLSGMDLLKHVKDQYPDVVFMMITAFGTTETAVEAMKIGAYDYITKPFKIDEVRINIANALRSQGLEVENRNLKKELNIEYNFQNLVGNSEPMHRIFELIRRVSLAPTNILITGESGTGKELVARAVHNLSGRKGKLVSVNCSAIPSELLESELFGHEKGSFTGAEKARAGRFEMASGGTLFLDEIGDMPLALQAKLLRALENRTIQRVGGGTDVKVDFRLVCATHQNIENDIEAGKFRADLFYRINVFPMTMPALASRTVDIPALLSAMMKSGETERAAQPTFTEGAHAELMRYPWPGNVRELRNLLERACLLFPGRQVEQADVKNNLLRIKVPDPIEEQEALVGLSRFGYCYRNP